MKNTTRKLLVILLTLVMVLGIFPIAALAAEDSSATMRVYHLDCGRKYFTEAQIKDLIDTLHEEGYNYMELAVGNDGLRFLLDDMSLSYSVGDQQRDYTGDAVKAEIIAGNRAYTTQSTGELSEAEMGRIIDYAAARGIEIIPLINTPGHMDAILYAGEKLTGKTLDYSGSVRTIDVTNTEAVVFTKALLAKYITYFANNDCTYFNMGADEYANDRFSSGGMGFGALVSSGKYGNFITYINDVSGMIKDAGMKPIAFNDGICYGSNEPVSIDRDIIVSYWSNGWSGYNLCPASSLASKGFKILNTNGSWYYILKPGDSHFNADIVTGCINDTPWDSVMGSSVSQDKLVGAMICLWSDEPGTAYAPAPAKQQIRDFAAKNSSIFSAPPTPIEPTEVVGFVDEIGNELTSFSLSAGGGARDLTFSGLEEGLMLNVSVVDESIITAEAKGNVITVTPLSAGTTMLTAAVASMSRAAGVGSVYELPITVLAAEEPLDTNINLQVGETATRTIEGVAANTYTGGTGIVNVAVVPSWTETAAASITDDTAYYIKNSSGQYLNSSASFVPDIADAAQWTAVANGSNWRLRMGTNTYLRAPASSGGNWRTTSGTGNAVTLYFNSGTFYRTRNVYAGKYTYSNPLGSPVTRTPASTAVSFTGNSVGTATVTVGHVTYTVNVTPPPLATDLVAEFWCTNVRLEDNGSYTMDIPFSELGTPVFVKDVVLFNTPIKPDAPTQAYGYWKSVILPEGSHQTTEAGDDKTFFGVEIIALMFDGEAYYYYSKANQNEAVAIKNTDQLVLYYKQGFVKLDNGHGAIIGADWGVDAYVSWAPYSIVYKIVETNADGSEVIEEKEVTSWYHGDGLVKSISVLFYDDGFETYKLTVKQDSDTTTYGEGGTEPIIPEDFTVDRGHNYEITYYIRALSTLSVDYFWMGAPTGATLPVDNNIYSENDLVTVDGSYSDGDVVTVGVNQYTFHGWYNNSSFIGDPVTEFVITAPTTLYAYWARVDTGGLRIVAGDSEKVYDGTPLTNSTYTVYYDNVPIPAVDGWYTANGITFRPNATVTGSQTNAGTSANQISGNIEYQGSGATFSNVQWVTGTLTVTAADVTITVDNKSKVYGDADPTLTGSVTGLVNANDLGTITYSRTNSTENNVGTYPNVLTASYTANSNYNVTVDKGDFEITAASGLTVTAKTASKTYDGAALEGLGTPSVADGTTVEYKVGTGEWTTTVPSITNVGTLEYKVRAKNANYADSAEVTGTLTVTKKTVTVTTGSASKTYDGTALTKDEASITGLVPGDAVTVTADGSQTVVGSSPNTYKIIWGGVNQANYTVIEMLGMLTVTAYIPIKEPEGTAVLVKVDASDNDTYLSGAKFELYRVTSIGSSLVGTYTTNSSGKISVSLDAGNYYWQEIGAPEGYTLDSTKHEFTVRYYTTTTVTVENSKTHIPDMFAVDHYAYIIGYGDGFVQPETNITRAEVATIFFRLLSDDVREANFTKTNSFTDVEPTAWYNTAVSTMAKLGIINGYTDGKFNPDSSITRAEFAAIAARFDRNGNRTPVAISDINGHWAMGEISIAANNGWVLGYEDGTFRPDQEITRAEAMAMLNRVLQRIPESKDDLLPGMVTWKDNADETKWYYLTVQEATNSHYYERKVSGYEYWTELRNICDWTALEQ